MTSRYVADLAPECRLMLGCARLTVDATAAARIRALLGGPLDWNKLIDWAVWHEVGPLLHRSLSEVAPDLVPPAVLFALRRNREGWAEHTGNLWRELTRVLAGLEAGGVAAMPFKGPVVAASLYGEMALRPFSDLDFLIHEGDVDRTLDLLETLDYVRPTALSWRQDRHFRLYACQYRMPRRDAKAWIEPHWALAQHMFAIDLDLAGMWHRASRTEMDGRSVSRLAPRDELLVLCVHGFREQWRRLKWVCDIAEFVRQAPALDWAALQRDAARAGCARILGLGLILARDLLDAPVPAGVVVDADRRLDWLVRRSLPVLFDAKLTGGTNWRPHAFHYYARERLGDRLRYLARTVLAPRPAMFEVVRLPDALFWAYYPMRWLHDYAALPLWLIWKRLRHR